MVGIAEVGRNAQMNAMNHQATDLRRWRDYHETFFNNLSHSGFFPFCRIRM